MELELENANVLDENLADRVKELIINNNIDKNKTYDLKLQFSEVV